jgi:hypothetical protein
MSKKFQNLDSDESIFFERELEALKSKTYDIKYPELKARTLIPVSFEAGPGAETISYEQYSQVGMAKLIANYADDLPRADVGAKKFSSPVKSVAMSYGWNLQEVRAAAMAGKPLVTRKAGAAKRGHMAMENSIAWFGDSASGLPGFLSNANVSTVVIPADGTGASALWSTKTPDQIIRDINLMTRTVHTVSKGVEFANTLLLPLEQFNLLFDTPRSSTSDTSIGKWVLDNNPHLDTIDWLEELNGTGPSGADQMAVYNRNPEKLTLEIPQDFEQLPVQERGLEFLVPTHHRVGGVIMYYPLSVAKASGI